MTIDLSNQVAIITGASRGIGRAIVHSLSNAGTKVALIARNLDLLSKLKEEISNNKGKAFIFPGDVTDVEFIRNTIQTINKEEGRIDILINNAGITRDTLLMRMKDEDWLNVIHTNLTAAFHTIREVSKIMLRQKYGRIVNITSVVGLTGNRAQANYAASKAGLIGLTKSAAKELATRGITVNAIAPGFIETDMTANLSKDIKSSILQAIPMGKIGNPEDVANVVLFLCSPLASYITGQTIAVDGGMVM
jgi:3-oxoacyl-[acyl-carrier protein] reductase